MRKYRKGMMVVLFALVFLASQAAIVGAQTKEDRNVTVKQELSQSEEENVIVGKVSVTNKGTETVKNVLIQSTLPEGLQLKEGSTLEKETASIEAGETVIHEFKAIYKNQEQAGTEDTPATEKPETAPATEKPETAPATEKPETAPITPQTDDDQEVMYYVLGIIGAGSIMLFLIKNKKVQFKKVLAILLCTIMALGMGAMPNVKAEGNVTRGSITVTDTITVLEQTFEIQSKVTYEVEEIVLPPVEEKGTFVGTVAEATNRSNFIQGATIEFYDIENNNNLAGTAITDINGGFTIDLEASTYQIKVSAQGYLPFECISGLEVGVKKHLETFLLIPIGESEEQGIAGGIIKDAVTGEEVEGVAIQIRTGWNQKNGQVVTTTETSENGFYQVTLPLGYYTVEMSKEGYITDWYNIIATKEGLLNQNETIVPMETERPSGDLRIVLTWGENPHDLDSHLFGPTADGSETFHTFFNKKEYEENGVKYVELDTDNIHSYGPETITVYKMNETGKYHYYVHDYTNRNKEHSKEMSNSGAMVKVYRDEHLIKTFNVPSNKDGILWHVFDYDAETNKIIPINKYKEDFESQYNILASIKQR